MKQALSKTLRAGVIAALTFASSVMAQAPLDYRQVPGASPEPITEGAGLKSREDLEAFIDGVMAAHLKQNHLAGAQVAVVKDGEIFFSKGYGYADVEKRLPVDPATTLFRPGSVAKVFTWVAVMQLVEQGKLDLDKDVNTYLTQFKIPATFDAPITLRNALTHTPGLEDGGIGYLFKRTTADLEPLADSLAAHMPKRMRPPTTDFSGDGGNASYSNYATALAGLIVANVSGMSFDDYLDKHIFEPLEMQHSTFRQPLPPAIASDMAKGYTFKEGIWKPYEHEFEVIQFAPAGSLSASTNDMANFMIAHLNYGEFKGQRILKEETARLMQSRVFSPGPHVNGAGLGLFETWVNGRRVIGHWGDMQTFHTSMDLLPEARIGIYVSYNSSHLDGTSIAREDLLRAFMDRYYPAKLPKLTPPADFKDRAGKYAGSYTLTRHSYTTAERLFTLGGAAKVVPTKDNTLMIAAGDKATQWVEIAPNTFRQIDKDENITFFENAKGEITGISLRLPYVAFYRLAWYQTPQLHWFVLGFGLLCFIVALVSCLRHWKIDRAATGPLRYARRLAAATGLLLLLFVILLVASLAANIETLFMGFPLTFKLALVLPLLAIPLALATLVLAVKAWREGWWTRYGRAQYSVIALFGLLFLWSLHSVNLIGWNFG